MTNVMEGQARSNRSGMDKYLTFKLGREAYAVGVLKIREIIRMLDITEVPQMPAYVKGVINLRGKVIPVVDLRLKFNLTDVRTTERTCIVVVQADLKRNSGSHLGLIVDAVEEVISIPPCDVAPTPDFGSAISTDYILGMAKVKGTVKTILDIDKVVSTEGLIASAEIDS
ncbi:MAG: chemotaxis protein CheW [Verrucomicrobiales bacterium]|nr:chemotaxis protein CheW [Verrucomicrobiales bacterium]MDB6131489.1 chemotaxis protein CheW [Verrucomicrobiales bacterium]